LICFEAVLLSIQKNLKYKAVSILAYFPRLDIKVRANDKFGRVTGKSMDHFRVAI
jgi:hypothetical protein